MTELLIIAILSILMLPVVIFTSGALRVILGLAFVLFFPGYTLVAALFPRKGNLDGIQRLALGLGLSIVVVPLIGLILNYTWEIRVYPILTSLLVFIIIMSCIAYYRRRQLMPEERFDPQLNKLLTILPLSWFRQSRWDKVLTVLLILAVAGAAVSITYFFTKPNVGESFTEFYILGTDDKADSYPQQLVLGERGTIILGIINNEHETMIYRVEIAIDHEVTDDIESIFLNHGEMWEKEVDIVPTKTGDNQEVDFLLYTQDNHEAYRSLHLWIDVK